MWSHSNPMWEDSVPFVTSQRDACQSRVFYRRWRYQKEEDGYVCVYIYISLIPIYQHFRCPQGSYPKPTKTKILDESKSRKTFKQANKQKPVSPVILQPEWSPGFHCRLASAKIPHVNQPFLLKPNKLLKKTNPPPPEPPYCQQ